MDSTPTKATPLYAGHESKTPESAGPQAQSLYADTIDVEGRLLTPKLTPIIPSFTSDVNLSHTDELVSLWENKENLDVSFMKMDLVPPPSPNSLIGSLINDSGLISTDDSLIEPILDSRPVFADVTEEYVSIYPQVANFSAKDLQVEQWWMDDNSQSAEIGHGSDSNFMDTPFEIPIDYSQIEKRTASKCKYYGQYISIKGGIR